VKFSYLDVRSALCLRVLKCCSRLFWYATVVYVPRALKQALYSIDYCVLMKLKYIEYS